MSLGASLFLVAVGANMHFAVTTTPAGIDIQVLGTILMVIAVIGFVITLWFYFANRRAAPGPPPPPSTTYR